MRIPPSLASPTRISFGHLSMTPVAPQPVSARTMATPTASDKPDVRATSPGNSQSTENVRLASGEANQVRPRLPRPAVCRSVTSTEPDGAPADARRKSSVLVDAHSSEQRMSKRLRRSPSKAARRGGSISKEDEEGEDNEDMGGTIGGRYYPRNGKRASLLPRTLRPPKRIDQAAFAGSSHESLPKPRSWILRVMVLRPMPSATAASIRRPPV